MKFLWDCHHYDHCVGILSFTCQSLVLGYVLLLGRTTKPDQQLVEHYLLKLQPPLSKQQQEGHQNHPEEKLPRAGYVTAIITSSGIAGRMSLGLSLPKQKMVVASLPHDIILNYLYQTHLHKYFD